MKNKNWFKKKEDTESKKEKTLKEKIGSHFTDILIFSPAVIIFALFFMGALGNYANIPNEDFLVNATANIERAANITINAFYKRGYERPKTFTFLFAFSIFMAFIYPIFLIIKDLIKWRFKKDDKQKLS